MSADVAWLLAAGVASWALTGGVRRYALARAMLDIPNARSSHRSPTPLGGGVAIAAVAGTGIALLALTGRLDGRTAVALVGGGGLVAVVGWLDDTRGLPVHLRLAAHCAAAAWALAWLGGVTTLRLGPTELSLGLLGPLLAGLLVVWMTNLFNFMDGIDGIAGAEALSVGMLAGLLLGSESGLGAAALLVAVSSAGFLIWNWAPARIFMGDVGSGFLGFVFAVLAVASESTARLSVFVWILLLGVFFVDATVTLLRRMLRGERWYVPHRSHAYQRLAASGWSHAQVTSAALALTFVLGVLAWLLARGLAPLGLVAVLGVALAVSAYCAVERRAPLRSSTER